MRGEDHVGQAAQLGDELVAAALRLLREDVDRGAGEVARSPGARRSASWSMTKPRDRLRNRLPRAHPGELLLAEEAAVAGPAVDVQGHHVGHLEQLVEGGAAAGVAQRQLVGGVVEVDASCRGSRPAPTAGCRCCRTRRCPSVRPRTSWLPSAALSQTPSCMPAFFSVSRRVSAMISARASSTTLRVLENGALKTATPAAGGGGQVDLVGADAERADREQVGRRRQHRGGDLGLGPDAEQVDAGRSARSARPRPAPGRASRRRTARP